jgi:Skp family chaperone for outer membrane proteins
MKKLLFVLSALVATVSLSAQAKIATIRMAECFDGYYETESVNSRMDSLRATIRADIDERRRALEADFKPIQDRAAEIRDNPGLSDEAKQAQLEALQPEVAPFQQREQELQQYAQQKEQEFRQRMAQSRQTLVDKITNVAREISIREGYDLLLDTSDATGMGPTVVYSSASMDITAKVLAELNRDQPAAATPAP